MFIYAALRREQLEFVKETPSLLLGCARVELRTTTTKPVVDSSSVKNGRGGQSQSLEEGRAGRWLSGSFHTLWMGPTHQGPAPRIFFDTRGTRSFRQ